MVSAFDRPSMSDLVFWRDESESRVPQMLSKPWRIQRFPQNLAFEINLVILPVLLKLTDVSKRSNDLGRGPLKGKITWFCFK